MPAFLLEWQWENVKGGKYPRKGQICRERVRWLIYSKGERKRSRESQQRAHDQIGDPLEPVILTEILSGRRSGPRNRRPAEKSTEGESREEIEGQFGRGPQL